MIQRDWRQRGEVGPSRVAILRLSFDDLARLLNLPKGVDLLEVKDSRDPDGEWINDSIDVRLRGEGFPLRFPWDNFVPMHLDDFGTKQLPVQDATEIAQGVVSDKLTGHGKVVCSCGAVIAQCRCPEDITRWRFVQVLARRAKPKRRHVS